MFFVFVPGGEGKPTGWRGGSVKGIGVTFKRGAFSYIQLFAWQTGGCFAKRRCKLEHQKADKVVNWSTKELKGARNGPKLKDSVS